MSGIAALLPNYVLEFLPEDCKYNQSESALDENGLFTEGMGFSTIVQETKGRTPFFYYQVLPEGCVNPTDLAKIKPDDKTPSIKIKNKEMKRSRDFWEEITNVMFPSSKILTDGVGGYDGNKNYVFKWSKEFLNTFRDNLGRWLLVAYDVYRVRNTRHEPDYGSGIFDAFNYLLVRSQTEKQEFITGLQDPNITVNHSGFDAVSYPYIELAFIKIKEGESIKDMIAEFKDVLYELEASGNALSNARK